jgi:hypothetical protein
VQVAEDLKSQEMRHRQEFALTISFVSRNAVFFRSRLNKKHSIPDNNSRPQP